MTSSGEFALKNDFVLVNKVPTQILTTRTTVLSEKDKPLILIIPGNPGIITYYEEFVYELSKHLGEDVDICGIGHAGHSTLPAELSYLSLEENGHLYDLNGQVEHKMRFIKDHLASGRPLILIGHSIGCYMILKMLKKNSELPVKMAYLLCPTIEKMVESPNGVKMKIGWKPVDYLVWFILLLLTVLPTFIKSFLIRLYFKDLSVDEFIFRATLSYSDPGCAGRSYFLARNEMELVRSRDDEVILQNLKKLKFYYARNDGWCPRTLYEDMKSTYPEADISLCDEDIEHAFVLKGSKKMAEMLSQTIKVQ